MDSGRIQEPQDKRSVEVLVVVRLCGRVLLSELQGGAQIARG